MYRKLAWLFLFPSVLFASPQLDTDYGYRTISAVVTNVEKESVYGEHVENELVSFFRTNPRFEYSDPGYLILRERVRPTRAPQNEIDENKSFTMLEPLKPTLKTLSQMGVGAAVLAEVIKDGDGKYRIMMELATTKDGESAFVTSKPVEGVSLDSFSLATKEALKEMMEWLPFDAAVIRRDGYLVVLDRGLPYFQKGQTLSAYTIEKKDGQIQFVESGVIGFTQVEENIAFGKILVERRPLEVTVGNKIRLDNKPAMKISPSLWSVSDRDIASSTRGDSFEVSKGRFGTVGAGLGASLVGFTTKGSTGPEQNMKGFYPNGSLNGELWLTSRVTVGLNLNYGMGGKKDVTSSTGANTSIGTSISGFRLLAGYRLNLLAPEPGPILHLRAGYGKQSYTFDSTRDLTFSSMTYAGILVSGGATFPVTERYGLGFDIESLIFPGVQEEPFTSGADVANISAWDFVFRGYYRWDKDIDFEGKLFFARNGATFSGARTRTLPYTESSQTTTGVQFGVSYYF